MPLVSARELSQVLLESNGPWKLSKPNYWIRIWGAAITIIVTKIRDPRTQFLADILQKVRESLSCMFDGPPKTTMGFESVRQWSTAELTIPSIKHFGWVFSLTNQKMVFFCPKISKLRVVKRRGEVIKTISFHNWTIP